jgi:D-alanyl-D-alanine dipeptidase
MLAAILTICGATVLTSFSKNDNPIVPTDDSSQFVTITDVVPDVILEIRYFGTYNFVGTRIDGYEEPVALMTRQAADSLRAASDDLRRHGYCIKIYDAYRPSAVWTISCVGHRI